ncbi:glycosyltransferase [Bacillus sp. OTU530]|uniref:glycosyltransferase n=1 Tax=Bacillus sp. OTU530 TaxID=3043862 RepID=UPI00313E7268
MKILHVLNSLLPSGAETMLKTSAEYWGVDLEKHILATSSDIGPYAIELENAGYIIHHISANNSFKQHYKVMKFIKNGKFDIVHVHTEGQALYYELDAKLGSAKKVIRTVHNVFSFNGLLRIRRTITRFLGRIIGVKHIAISQSVYENEKKMFYNTCNAIVNNWYDETIFNFTSEETKREARAKLGISLDEFCIVSVGNCNIVKNHMSILRALVELKKRNHKFVYLHVGKGALEGEEKEFTLKNDLQENVRFIGFENPLTYLRAADLYIMPSLYEGVGIAALEAIGTGIPVLLTNVAGLKDFKEHAFDNVVYCELDNDSIKNGILDCIDSFKKEKYTNSSKQVEEVQKIYGIKQGVKGYLKFYK